MPPASPLGLFALAAPCLEELPPIRHRLCALDELRELSPMPPEPHDDASELLEALAWAATSNGNRPFGFSSGSGAPLYRAAAICSAIANSSPFNFPSMSTSFITQM
eukprot:scaffold254052_cov27-Tisochrysis_lutea.AAC.4